MTPGAARDAALLRAVGQAFPGDPPQVLAVAVSGGGDSMALLDLAMQVQAARGGQLHAVTVDHALRPEAADEARFVAGHCARQGIPHVTLRWDHGPIDGNLQDQARRARTRLIGDWARGAGIGHVMLAHTADDQAETFLMGLARAAGIDGLSGMRPLWREGGLLWARPLLDQSRADLRDWLTARGIGWVEDPSNHDARFARVRARQALTVLAPLGITAAGLAGTARHLAEAQAALRHLTLTAARAIASGTGGEIVLQRAGFHDLPPGIARRLLIAALRWLSGADHPPRAADLARLQAAIAAGRAATLMGCRVRPGADLIRLQREERAVADLSSPTDQPWDGRWHLTGPHAPDLTIRALGAHGLALCGDWRARGLPRAVLIASPAIWRGAALIAAPLAGFGANWAAELDPSFHSFLLSD